MPPTTFIKLDRSILNWRWYKNPNTFRVFMHLLLNANIKDKDFCNITVHRGEIVVSNETLATALGLTVQNIRTALNNLKKTGEITRKRCSNFQVISIENYELYQDNQQATNSQSTANQQPANSQSTTTKEIKNERNKEINNLRSGEEKRKETELINNKDKNTEPYKEKTSHTRIPRGKFNNVYLSDEEFEKLQTEEIAGQFYIDKLSAHIKSTGKNYLDHYATICSWIMEDKKKGYKNIPVCSNGDKNTRASYDIEAAIRKAKLEVPVFKKKEKR